MISPPIFWAIKALAASRDTRNEPRAIISNCKSQSATVVSVIGLAIEIPALLTTISIPPKASMVAAIASAIAVSLVTSIATAIALSAPPNSAANLVAPSKSRSATTTQAPSAAKRSAVALPNPEAAPVTSAIREASGFGFGIRFNFASSKSQYSILNFSDSSIGA